MSGCSAMGSSANGPKTIYLPTMAISGLQSLCCYCSVVVNFIPGNLAFSTKASERYCKLKFDYKLINLHISSISEQSCKNLKKTAVSS